eukprot:gnl/MRDRNA2_/MRDRNA2_65188_c0_seq2.p2 gnl/MRDRNA2_/MRDRNA2_65188_c0~~gnl/MRDRNA2_/MRDRNA2_65188_c0_seq2.p2  ORF type:complete len:156 (-),score=44.11 gnl/MRDRNA2_/MRDRNA2_65188_c0_seq2:142-609(-)
MEEPSAGGGSSLGPAVCGAVGGVLLLLGAVCAWRHRERKRGSVVPLPLPVAAPEPVAQAPELQVQQGQRQSQAPIPEMAANAWPALGALDPAVDPPVSPDAIDPPASSNSTDSHAPSKSMDPPVPTQRFPESQEDRSVSPESQEEQQDLLVDHNA